jgi:hypothetical protein
MGHRGQGGVTAALVNQLLRLSSSCVPRQCGAAYRDLLTGDRCTVWRPARSDDKHRPARKGGGDPPLSCARLRSGSVWRVREYKVMVGPIASGWVARCRDASDGIDAARLHHPVAGDALPGPADEDAFGKVSAALQS